MTGHGLDDAIESLRRELGDVRAVNKCATCECFLGVVAQAEGRVRTCQHCEVCVPVGPYRRYREAVGGPSDVDTSLAGGAGRCS